MVPARGQEHSAPDGAADSLEQWDAIDISSRRDEAGEFIFSKSMTARYLLSPVR